MPVFVVKPQPLTSFTSLLSLNCAMMRSKPTSGMRLTKSAFSLAASKSFPGTRPIFAKPASAGASAADGGLVFNSWERRPKYSFAFILLTCSRTAVFHIDRRIDLAFRWRVGLSVGTQRHQFALVLQLMDCLVVLRRAGAVDP